MSDLPRRLGTSIRIFLASGEADGVWVAEKSNWTGKALMAPRTRFRDLRSRSDLTGPGIYLLIGPSESELQAHRFYIGETDDLPRRLDDHNRNKRHRPRRVSCWAVLPMVGSNGNRPTARLSRTCKRQSHLLDIAS